jgi:SAM-dependent methyltransferase
MTQDAPANTDQIAYWNDAAGRTWAEFQAALDRQVEPLGARVVEVLAPAAAERFLDIGCGCGQTTLELAKRVGPLGAVLGVDISQPMLAVARERAAGLPQASFLEADAQTHPFEAGTYDAIHSRFGVMFFQDPGAAFANLRRALKPGGRLAFVCWRSPAENPIMILPMVAAAAHLPPTDPPAPGAPGPFAFADGDRLRGLLAGAGFRDIAVEPQDMAAGGNDLDGAVNLALRVGPLGSILRERPELRPAVVADVRSALEAHLVDGRVYLPSATWIVSARKG